MAGKEEFMFEKLPAPISIPHHYTPDQILLFQGRCENGYDIFADSDYINWLCEIHLDALLGNLCESGEDHLPSLQTCSSWTTLHDDLHASTV